MEQAIKDAIKGSKTIVIGNQYNNIQIVFDNCNVSSNTLTTEQQNILKTNVAHQKTVDFQDPAVQEKIVQVISKQRNDISKTNIEKKIADVISSTFQSNSINITFSDCDIKNADIIIKQYNFQQEIINKIVESLSDNNNKKNTPISKNQIWIVIISISCIGLSLGIILLLFFLFRKPIPLSRVK